MILHFDFVLLREKMRKNVVFLEIRGVELSLINGIYRLALILAGEFVTLADKRSQTKSC